MESGLPRTLPRAIAALLQESRGAEDKGDWTAARAYLQQALESPDARHADGLACILLRLIARTYRKEGDLDAAADACEAAIAAAERHPAAAALTHALAERAAIALHGGAGGAGGASGAGDGAHRASPHELRIQLLDAEQLSLLEARHDEVKMAPTPGRGLDVVPGDELSLLRVVATTAGDGARALARSALLGARGVVLTPLAQPFSVQDPTLSPTPNAILLDGRSPRLLSEIGELRAHCASAAIVVLGGATSLASVIQLTDLGAQDVGPLPSSPESIERMIRLAVSRQQRENQLRALAMVDPLTGLYNRRGFMTLVRQQEQLALRLNRRMLHVFIDLDGLKRINDGFGHQEGDRALQATGDLLRRTFRESDVIARIGGDEFAVLAVEMDEPWSRSWEERLQQQLDEANAEANRGYEITLSVGVAALDPRAPRGTDELLGAADVAMYQVKRAHRGMADDASIPLPTPAQPWRPPQVDRPEVS